MPVMTDYQWNVYCDNGLTELWIASLWFQWFRKSS